MQAADSNTVVSITSAPGRLPRVLAAAQRAGERWRRLPVAARLERIACLRDRLAVEAPGIAAAIERRPPEETLSGEILPLLEACRFLERHAPAILRTRRSPVRPGLALRGVKLDIEREAYGTVLIVGPANYGLMLPGIQALQAIVAGNAVIIKPAPGTRAALELLANWLRQCGAPRGLLTVTDESVETVTELLEAGVDKLVFTGSSTTGRNLLLQAAATMTPVAAELSGWDACIVLESADPALAARAIAFGMRFNAGETCLAPRRILVGRDLYDPLADCLRAELAQTGPVAFAPAARTRAREYIDAAIAAGARLACGELGPDGPIGPIGPILLSGVTPDMAIFHSEVFGPIALMTRTANVDHAIDLANVTDYALGATIFGDPQEARTVARRLDAGLVMINDAIAPAAHPGLPIAPRRGSGSGVTRGTEGLLEFTRPRVVVHNRARHRWHLAPPTPGADRLLGLWLQVAYRRRWRDRARAVLQLITGFRNRFRQERS